MVHQKPASSRKYSAKFSRPLDLNRWKIINIALVLKSFKGFIVVGLFHASQYSQWGRIKKKFHEMKI